MLFAMRTFFLLPLLAAMISFIACDSDDGDTAILILSDSIVGSQTVQSSSILYISFSVTAYKAELRDFCVNATPQGGERETLVDTTIGGRSFLYELEYNAPQYSEDTTIVTITASATDVDGNSQSTSCKVNVVASTKSLVEHGSFSLYTTEENDHANGFSFDRLSLVVVSLTDSSEVDVYPYLDEAKVDSLTCTLLGGNNINFARAGSFDYSNATDRSVTNAYESMVYQSRIQNLTADDIILVGREDEALGVMKILYVDDEEGSANDRYVFSVKVIE